MIPDKVVQQILAIRESAKFNMLDVIGVQREAHDRQYYELVIFLEEHRDDYSRFILSGER